MARFAPHVLAVMPDVGGPCRTYKDSATVKNDAALKAQCQAKTGPNAPGVDTPRFRFTLGIRWAPVVREHDNPAPKPPPPVDVETERQ